MSFFDIFQKKAPAAPKVKVLHDRVFITGGKPASSPRSEYEANKCDPLAASAKVRTELTRTEQLWHNEQDRLRDYIKADWLWENTTIGSTLDRCVRMAIGAKGGCPYFLNDADGRLKREFSAWKRTAGFAEGESWQDVLSLVLRLVKLHGDCIVLCDRRLTGGKVRIWDADQICSVSSADFAAWCRAFGAEGWRCAHGVVMDEYGAVRGWFVTSKRNQLMAPMDEAFFISTELGRRVSYHRLHTQIRGESSLLRMMDITMDTRDFTKNEVAAGKLRASLGVVVEQTQGAIDNPDLAALAQLSTDQATSGTDVTEEDIQEAIKERMLSDKTFESFPGAAVAELPEGKHAVFPQNQSTPSGSLQEWQKNLDDMNASNLGAMSLFGRGRADNSYSSGQIEIAISWASFEEDQKMLERQVVDYVIGVLWPEAEYMVKWPQAFEIDPEKAEKTQDARWRGLRCGLADMLGPEWREKLRQYAEEKAEIEKNGLSYASVFQGISGGLVAEPAIVEDEQQ